MRDTLVYRGPDDAGVVVLNEDRVALGHRRLSIIDLSAAGHQPMSNEDGSLWITYNGEVYNHRDAARGAARPRATVPLAHRHRDDLHLYEEEGRALRRAPGRDVRVRDLGRARKRELFLARDRIGVKPLYYAQLPGGVVFGSEIKAILAPSGGQRRARRGAPSSTT